MDWLVVLGFNATLTAKVISWRSVTHMCFPGFLTPVLTRLFFPKPPTSFPTCFYRGERRKYAGKKSRLNWGSNLQPPGHESDTLTTEPPRRGKLSWNNLPSLHELNIDLPESMFQVAHQLVKENKNVPHYFEIHIYKYRSYSPNKCRWKTPLTDAHMHPHTHTT